jgi:hypothetical protein
MALLDGTVEAVQRRCHFTESDGAIVLDGQPIQTQRQLCRIFDAKTGLIEEDYVKVWDMVTRSPWPEPSDEFPSTSRLTTSTPRYDLRGAGDAAEGPARSPRNDPRFGTEDEERHDRDRNDREVPDAGGRPLRL